MFKNYLTVAYRNLLRNKMGISIPIWIYVTSGTVAIFVGMATISWQTIRAARANPVHAIKSE